MDETTPVMVNLSVPKVADTFCTCYRSTVTTDGRSTRWAQHRLERRKELVEATLRAIRRHGARVGMDEIAVVAGTSKTVFYRHFTDRTGLYQAVTEQVDALILRDLGRALGEAGTPLVALHASPPEIVSAAIDSYLALVEKDPEVYRFVVAAPMLDRSDAHPDGDPASAVTGHVAVQLEVVLHQALRQSGYDVASAPVWARGVVGMVRAAADAWLAEEVGLAGMPRAQLTRHLTLLAWTGLSTAWQGDGSGLPGPGRPLTPGVPSTPVASPARAVPPPAVPPPA